ncbi:MAG: GIY-YIG nuclease family protein [Hyphomicrobiaceae bacterium]
MPAKAGTHGRRSSAVLVDVQSSSSKEPAVYILASKRDGVLYIGVSSEPWDRVNAHKQGLLEGFTRKYAVKTLVYIEFFDDMPSAIRREKQLKKWNRGWKVRLIEQINPEWQDLWLPTGELLRVGRGGQQQSRA